MDQVTPLFNKCGIILLRMTVERIIRFSLLHDPSLDTEAQVRILALSIKDVLCGNRPDVFIHHMVFTDRIISPAKGSHQQRIGRKREGRFQTCRFGPGVFLCPPGFCHNRYGIRLLHRLRFRPRLGLWFGSGNMNLSALPFFFLGYFLGFIHGTFLLCFYTINMRSCWPCPPKRLRSSGQCQQMDFLLLWLRNRDTMSAGRYSRPLAMIPACREDFLSVRRRAHPRERPGQSYGK